MFDELNIIASLVAIAFLVGVLIVGKRQRKGSFAGVQSEIERTILSCQQQQLEKFPNDSRRILTVRRFFSSWQVRVSMGSGALLVFILREVGYNEFRTKEIHVIEHETRKFGSHAPGLYRKPMARVMNWWREW